MPPKGSLTKKLDASVRQLPILSELPAGGRYPCDSCPLNKPQIQKVPPDIAANPLFGMVGTATGLLERQIKLDYFAGRTGQFFREELVRVGLLNGHDDRIAFFNLTRCRPEKGGANSRSPEWLAGVENCWTFLQNDLAGSYPLLVMGDVALKKVLGDLGVNFNIKRGLWLRTPSGRQIFPLWHHAWVYDKKDEDPRRLRQYRSDLKRAADRILGREKPSVIHVDVFPSPSEASGFLGMLAMHKKPWAFDIETYDAENPGKAREKVATDPFHPDFRVRGVALAWRPDRGAWIELMGWEDRKQDAAALLGPAFSSPAEKIAFNGAFDENGLVYGGWVPEIANRSGDGMLGLVSANAGGHEGLSLERAVVELLDEPQWWGLNKLGIGAAPIRAVAESSVRDACHTLSLSELIHGRLERGDYIVPEKEMEL